MLLIVRYFYSMYAEKAVESMLSYARFEEKVPLLDNFYFLGKN